MITAGGNCLQDIFFSAGETQKRNKKNKSRMHILPSLSYMLHIQYAAFIFVDSSFFFFFFYHSASPFDF